MCTLYFEPVNISASVHSITCNQLSRLWESETTFLIPLDARCYHNLNCSESVNCAPQQLYQSTCSSRPPMEALGATSAVVGLAIPVFKCAKELRDKIKLVRPLPFEPSAYYQGAHDYSMFYIRVRRSHRRKRNSWQRSSNTKRISTSSSHSITTTRHYWTSTNSTLT